MFIKAKRSFIVSAIMIICIILSYGCYYYYFTNVTEAAVSTGLLSKEWKQSKIDPEVLDSNRQTALLLRHEVSLIQSKLGSSTEIYAPFTSIMEKLSVLRKIPCQRLAYYGALRMFLQAIESNRNKVIGNSHHLQKKLFDYLIVCHEELEHGAFHEMIQYARLCHTLMKNDKLLHVHKDFWIGPFSESVPVNSLTFREPERFLSKISKIYCQSDLQHAIEVSNRQSESGLSYSAFFYKYIVSMLRMTADMRVETSLVLEHLKQWK